jgi:hypothetical protein
MSGTHEKQFAVNRCGSPQTTRESGEIPCSRVDFSANQVNRFDFIQGASCVRARERGEVGRWMGEALPVIEKLLPYGFHVLEYRE